MSQRPVSLRAWVESAWLALGGPACTADPADRDNAEAFFGLLEETDDGGRLDVAALTRRIEDLHAKPDPDADDSLQVMTIHKAKGLEFDVVILPGLGRKTRSDEAHLMLWLEKPRLGGEPELLMAPIPATGADDDTTYDYLKLIDARKSEYEAERLLYVAPRRAKSELHLLGHVRFKAEDGVIKLKPESHSLLERMWSVAGPVFEAAVATVMGAKTPFFVEWDNCYGVGVQAIDHMHRFLPLKIPKLQEAMAEGCWTTSLEWKASSL